MNKVLAIVNRIPLVVRILLIYLFCFIAPLFIGYWNFNVIITKAHFSIFQWITTIITIIIGYSIIALLYRHEYLQSKTKRLGL